jgi:trk system potassium uptake protein TrkA
VMRWILPAQSAIDWVDPSARVCLVERPVPSSWAGRPVSELDIPGTGRIVALSRLGVAQVPTKELLVQESDVVYAAVGGDAIDQFDAHLAQPPAGGKH